MNYQLPSHPRRASREVTATLGLVVEDVETGWVGAVVRTEKAGGMQVVHLEDRKGAVRAFPVGPGFWLDGAPVTLLPARAEVPESHRAPHGESAGGRRLSASGSIARPVGPAQVARASRLWVEGTHDAELVERVWGDDLREVAVVVELLDGADHLEAVLRDFSPGPGRRAGVLLDHLVAGTKETRLVSGALAGLGKASEHVLVLGHPYVDVWQAIKPERVGLHAWPDIPRGTDIKKGTLRALGWPHETATDVALGWKGILRTVRTYRDLEVSLVARMEELIDFVTAPGA